MSANRFAGLVIYQLEKDHGINVDLYLRGQVSQNVETGVPAINETKWKIKRVPILEMETLDPKKLPRSVGSLFEYGGYYNTTGTFLIISWKKLPKNYLLNQDDAFIIKHRRWQIKNTKDIQETQLVLFEIEELQGQDVNEIVSNKDCLVLLD